jgi:hypothetical protein
MKPLDRYKAMIANAFQAHETSHTVDVDLVLAEARKTALMPSADGTVPSGAAAQQAIDAATAAAIASLTAVGETREAGLLALAVRNNKGQIVPTPWFVQEAKRVQVHLGSCCNNSTPFHTGDPVALTNDDGLPIYVCWFSAPRPFHRLQAFQASVQRAAANQSVSSSSSPFATEVDAVLSSRTSAAIDLVHQAQAQHVQFAKQAGVSPSSFLPLVASQVCVDTTL